MFETYEDEHFELLREKLEPLGETAILYIEHLCKSRRFYEIETFMGPEVSKLVFTELIEITQRVAIGEYLKELSKDKDSKLIFTHDEKEHKVYIDLDLSDDSQCGEESSETKLEKFISEMKKLTLKDQAKIANFHQKVEEIVISSYLPNQSSKKEENTQEDFVLKCPSVKIQQDFTGKKKKRKNYKKESQRNQNEKRKRTKNKKNQNPTISLKTFLTYQKMKKLWKNSSETNRFMNKK